MFRSWIAVVLVLAGLEACSHHGAVRVQCEGPLRPINLPDANPPVSIIPAPASPRDTDPQP
jgi:hypothetical protein